MKLHKVLTYSLVITLLAVCYVHQRVELVETGYDLQKKRKYLAYLVDQNSQLMYNLSKLESPRHLLASLDGDEIEFGNTRSKKNESYLVASRIDSISSPNPGFVAKFLDIFTINAEARSRNSNASR